MNYLKKHFKFQRPSDMLKLLYTTKEKAKNNELVNVINSGLKEIIKMSKDEKKIEKPNKIVEIVEEILKFNKQQQLGTGLKF